MKSPICRPPASILVVALSAVLGPALEAVPPPPGGDLYNGYRSRSTITLPVTIRDFQRAGDPGGHADFFNSASGGSGRYAKIAADTLASDGKPVFSSTGYRVSTDWHDSAGHPLIPTRSYIDAMPGDFAGSMSGSPGGAVTSGATFAQWFRDVPGVNTGAQRQLAMAFDSASQAYVFDGTFDQWRGAGLNDYNYTLDMESELVYERGQGWYVAVGTTGDAFLFVDDKQVLDLGSGIAPAGISGIVVNGLVVLQNSSTVAPAVAGGRANVTTMSTAAATISMYNSSSVTGNVAVGVGGNPGTAISMAGSAVITGTRTALSSAMTLPVLPAIPNVGPSVGDRAYGSDTTLSADLHCNNLQVNSTAKLFISGQRIIVCENSFQLLSSSQVQVMANSSLTLYTHGLSTSATSLLNANTANPAVVTIYLYGTGPLTSASNSGVYANLMAPAANFSMASNSRFWGNAYTNGINLGSGASFTVVDTGSWGPPAGPAGPGMSGMQRIDLDRLAWLGADRTHRLRLFFANRTGQASRLRVETNMSLLRIAALPLAGQAD